MDHNAIGLIKNCLNCVTSCIAEDSGELALQETGKCPGSSLIFYINLNGTLIRPSGCIQ